MIRRFKQILFVGLLASSFSVSAADNWNFGVGLGILLSNPDENNAPVVISNIVDIGNGSINGDVWSDDESSAIATLEFYAVHSKYPEWSYMVAIAPSVTHEYWVGAGLSATNVTIAPPYTMDPVFIGQIEGGDLGRVEMNSTMLELGVAYDLFHTDSGWFIDAAVKAGFQLAGDSTKDVMDATLNDGVTNYATKMTFGSGMDEGYNRLELGFGKTIGNWLLRFALVQVNYNGAPSLAITTSPGGLTSTSSLEAEAVSVTSQQLSLTYWW